MKNWPKSELSFFDRLNIHLTKKIYQFALKKERKNRVLKRLFVEAKHHEKGLDTLSSNVSQFGSNLNLEEIVYYDIFPIEEFENLEKGISRITQKYPWPKSSLGYIFHRSNKTNEFLKNAQKIKYRGGYSAAGGAYFGDNPKFEFIESVSIWVATVSPSYFCVIFVASPSEKFKDKFLHISKRSEDLEVRITFPNIKFGFNNLRNWHRFGHSSRNIIDPKHRKLDELLLKGNKEIVKCIRKYINAGMAMRGPIPQVEVISTTEQLKNVPTDTLRNNESKFDRQFSKYLEYIGYSYYRLKPYTNEWAHFYQVFRSKNSNLSSHQILIGLDETQENYRKEVLGKLYHLYPFLCPSLSIQDYLRFINLSLFKLNKRVSKVLDKETSKGISVRGFRKNISETAKINWLKFQQLRIWSELSEFETFKYLKKHMETFERDKFGWEKEKAKKVNLIDGLKSNAIRMQESNERNFEFLYEANNQFLRLKNIVITNRLQWAVVALTLFLFLLTILLLPREFQQIIWDYLTNLI